MIARPEVYCSKPNLPRNLRLLNLAYPFNRVGVTSFFDFEKLIRLGFYCKKIYKYSSRLRSGNFGLCQSKGACLCRASKLWRCSHPNSPFSRPVTASQVEPVPTQELHHLSSTTSPWIHCISIPSLRSKDRPRYNKWSLSIHHNCRPRCNVIGGECQSRGTLRLRVVFISL